MKYLNQLKKIFLELQPSQSSLVGAMQKLRGEDLANSKSRVVGGIPQDMWTPYKPFPNITKFRIVVSKLNEILLKVGIKKRLDKAGFDFTYYRNRDLNRFIGHQLLRLKKADNRTYYFLQLQLIHKSRTWYMMSVRHVFPRWFREMPWWKFMQMRKRYNLIGKRQIPEIDFKRVYIEKASGKWRPLGVPKPEWRLYLHLINQALVFRLAPTLRENQHGFIPEKGTLTAWIEIMTKVINSPNIYEYDLKGYFDNLKQAFLNNVLENSGLCGPFFERLKIINQSIAQLPEKDLMYEADREVILTRNGEIHPNFKEIMESEEFKEEMKYAPSNIEEHVGAFESFPMRIYKTWLYGAQNWENPGDTGNTNYPRKTDGLPQGAPTSPFLSNITLNSSLLALWKEIVQYADDGIMYGEDLCTEVVQDIFRHGICQVAGIILSVEKSGWVKKDGIWLKPLKFLGLQYDGTTGELSANTRKGSRLVYDKATLLSALEEGYFDAGGTSGGNPKPPMSWERFAVSKYAGWVLSRLYNGSWNQDEYTQNFSLTYSKGTWVSEYIRLERIQNMKQNTAKLFKIREMLLGRGEAEPDDPDLYTINENIMHLTVFNASSIATRAALEALRLAEGMSVVQLPHEKKDKESNVTLDSRKKVEVGTNWSNYNHYQKKNIHKWYKAYGGSLVDYKVFILGEIERMEKYSRYCAEEMYLHYMAKYLVHKEQQIHHVLIKGERLSDEVRRELKALSLSSKPSS